jgi:hypothetical protein
MTRVDECVAYFFKIFFKIKMKDGARTSGSNRSEQSRCVEGILVIVLLCVSVH